MATRTLRLPKSRQDKHRFWQEHVNRQQLSGLSQRNYCRQHDVGYASFVRWRRLLRQQSSMSTALVPVRVSTSPETAQKSSPSSLALIMPDGVRIEGITCESIELAAELVARL